MADTPTDPPTDVRFDAALDELYTAPPGDFVLTRARLERELKDAGQAEAAAAVKRLRRPSLAVWAVNQLAHEEPDAVEALVTSTATMRATQHALLQGSDPAALREAFQERQAVLSELIEAAISALAPYAPKPAAHTDDIANLLEAASLDDDASKLLVTGRLTRMLAPQVGFDALGDAPPVLTLAGAPRKKVDQPRRARREIESAQRDVEKARSQADAASTAAEEADAELASAGIAIDTAASSHVDDVERALAQAREELRSAERRVEERTARADAAIRAAEEARERLRRAEDRLRTLDT